MKRELIAAALAGTLILTGCSVTTSSDSSGASSVSASTSSEYIPKTYTLDELKAKINETGMTSETFKDNTDADFSEEAVEAYNELLAYAEKVLGNDDYKLFDFYSDIQLKKYVVKIVLNEYRNGKDTENAPILLYKKGGEINSCLEGFLYAREWTEQLRKELTDAVPAYCHLNTMFLASDQIAVGSGDMTYDLSEIGNIKPSGKWRINLILKPGTSKLDFDVTFETIKPILDKYGVTELNVFVPKNSRIYDSFISEETITGNIYFFNAKEEFDWSERNYKGGS